MNQQIDKKISLEKLNALGITIQKVPIELKPLDDDNILFDGGLHLVYSPSGARKSYTFAYLTAKTNKKVMYFDLEENPGGLKRFCESLNIVFTHVNNPLRVIEQLINVKLDCSEYIFIFDSFSCLLDEANANTNPTDTARIVKRALSLCRDLKATVIIIDHATKNTWIDKKTNEEKFTFKVEGNESGKKKPLDIMYRLEPIDWSDYTSDVKLTCEKSRVENLKVGDTKFVNSYKREVKNKRNSNEQSLY